MPSGSHRTSGGSHSSGGSFSSSRSSSSGGSGSFGRNYHRGPRVYVNGIPMGPVGSLVMYFVFLFIFMPAFTFAGIMMLNINKKELAEVEQDYIYYQDMIDFAKENNSPTTKYIITGTITGKFASEYEGKWYLEYSFKSSYGSTAFYGETHAIYDYEDVKNIVPNVTTIQLAADSYIITSSTDTVNMDYEYTTLEDDGYYLSLKNGSNKLFAILFICVGLGCGALFIYLIVKGFKNIKKPNTEETEIPSYNKIEPEIKEKPSYCNYCGAVVPVGRSRCPSCGAKK